ncbi:MAG: hypothetical protein HON68_09855 [Gammaproteobacteria bacterium]|nr:hypothetical protein [Gammaproteobacteria bacterium]MBT3719465.1 hypothetical protein [Gammaproteobacteria bacterium]MBT3845622.1 hypothetical protein [Gammaproteobacteria bacterium]MBT3894152.1 hypothetical protein [Gammaproteobacteria bacterium]MBT4301680.1 hypothetical protein [Gammaproteobacteria bacterium]
MFATPCKRDFARCAYFCTVEYLARVSISNLVKRLKRGSSRILQNEFPELRKRYWDRHF